MNKSVLQIPIARSPRLPVLGQGYLLPEAGSSGGRPKNTISQLLIVPQSSITTQFAVEMVVNPLKASVFQFFCTLLLKMTIHCQSGLLTFGQGYLIFGVGRPQDYWRILTSLQR